MKKLTIFEYLVIAALVLAGAVLAYAFGGAELALPGAAVTKSWIIEKSAPILAAGGLSTLAVVVKTIFSLRNSNSAVTSQIAAYTGEFANKQGELTEAIAAIKDLKAELNDLKASARENKEGLDTVNAISEYVLSKASNDPFVKEAFLKIRENEAVKKVEEYVEKKAEKAKRTGLTISKKV